VALTLSGLPSDRFLFAGFLPAKDKARADTLAELANAPATLVFFETAPRLIRSLQTIGESLPGREVAVARELTKMFEECRSGTPAELAAHYQAHPPKGELVVLVGPPEKALTSEADADGLLRAAGVPCPDASHARAGDCHRQRNARRARVTFQCSEGRRVGADRERTCRNFVAAAATAAAATGRKHPTEQQTCCQAHGVHEASPAAVRLLCRIVAARHG
jgi:hypothetical protein